VRIIGPSTSVVVLAAFSTAGWESDCLVLVSL
jgi:hypothetical protein